MAVVVGSDLARRSPKAAADVEHPIPSGEGEVPRQLAGGGPAANVKLIDRREVLGRDRAFRPAHAGKTVANGCDEAAARVVFSNLGTHRGFHHRTLMPASRITFAQRVASFAMCLAHSSDVLPTG